MLTNPPDAVAVLEALARLIEEAKDDTGSARRASDFLLAWHNTPENGGWDPVDLWSVKEQTASDMLTLLQFLACKRTYADELGFDKEIAEVWSTWRGHRDLASQKRSD